MLFSAGRVALLRDRDEVVLDCTRRRQLTGRLTHILWVGVVLAVSVVTEAGVLESVFSFGGVDVGFR